MKRIPLTKGQYALVDDADFDMVNQHSWVYTKHNTNHYAHTTISEGGRRKTVKMHRMILNAPNGKEVDHKGSHRTGRLRNVSTRVVSRKSNRSRQPKRS